MKHEFLYDARMKLQRSNFVFSYNIESQVPLAALTESGRHGPQSV
jgi:hypothetical protein